MILPHAAASVIDLLTLEGLGDDRFVSRAVLDDGLRLYGGLTFALCVRAAALTAHSSFVPHSVQCSFVHAGDPAAVIELAVERDRDGRSFATRTVTARQNGRLLARATVSLQVPEVGTDAQVDRMPVAPGPDGLPSFAVPRLLSMEGRLPPQPHPRDDWPTRFWVRCTAPFDTADTGLQASIAAYLSDISSGLVPLSDDDWSYGPSLNHTLWLHRPVRMDDWLLFDLVPHTAAGGRGWYTGTLSTVDGILVGSIAQEALFRAAGRHSNTPLELVRAALAGPSERANSDERQDAE
ncbi:MAG: acyl-CoA thioesterase [Subtercola sp.]|nr:acyl-CoA thioesterase [Subtercola sp.]